MDTVAVMPLAGAASAIPATQDQPAVCITHVSKSTVDMARVESMQIRQGVSLSACAMLPTVAGNARYSTRAQGSD